MIDWNLAIKIAAGGFGQVFIILVILGCSVWITKLVSNKLYKGKAKERKQV